MNIYRKASATISFDGIKTWFNQNVFDKMSERDKKIAAVVGAAIALLTALTCVCKKLRSSSSNQELQSVPLAVKNTKNAKNNQPSIDSEVKVIRASDFNDQQKAIKAVNAISPTKYLEKQYDGNKFLKTSLAVQGDKIVGFISGEAKPQGVFFVHQAIVNTDQNSSDLLSNLFASAMAQAKEMGRQTLTVDTKNVYNNGAVVDLAFYQDLKNFKVVPANSVSTYQDPIHNKSYSKTLDIALENFKV